MLVFLWPLGSWGTILGTLDPLLPCFTEGEIESGSRVLQRLQRKKRTERRPEPKFLDSQLDRHLAFPQASAVVGGLGAVTAFLG